MEKIKEAVLTYKGINQQIIKFLIVGGFTFAIDYLFMVILVEIGDVNYLISTGIGFVIGSTINYILSVKFVFVSGKYDRTETEFMIFMFFTTLGLVINHFVMYLGCNFVNFDYRIVKIISLIIVTVFSFITKKTFVFVK